MSRFSEKAQQVLENRHKLSRTVAEPIAEEARSEAYRLYSAALDPEGNAQLTEEMNRFNELDAFTILSAVQTGNLAFFEAAMSARTKIPVDNVRRLIRLGRRSGTLGLCKKANIPGLLHEDFHGSRRSRFAASGR